MALGSPRESTGESAAAGRCPGSPEGPNRTSESLNSLGGSGEFVANADINEYKKRGPRYSDCTYGMPKGGRSALASNSRPSQLSRNSYLEMVKSLLLGSAAGLVAVAGAQAADLPVKAKPVQYVKICSLYGVGFYYIPGTDMCIKIGGWVRAEYGWGQNGNFAWGWANNNVNNRSTNNSDFRARGYITADARNQTEYGTVRGYIAVGLSENEHGGDVNASTSFSANRAFIQWAGFTFGRAQSFFDFYSNPATSYWGAFPGSDTGDGGWFVMGYTAQFGNGFSATIAAEAPRRTQLFGVLWCALVWHNGSLRGQQRCRCLRRLPGPRRSGQPAC